MDWHLILFIAVAAAIIIHAVIKERKWASHLKQNGIQVQGIVLRNKFHFGRISVFRPVIQFQTEEGNTIEADDIHGWAMAIPRYSKGEKVAVIYDKTNPADFKIV